MRRNIKERLLLALLVLPGHALAACAGSSVPPWEIPLRMFFTSLNEIAALSAAIIGLLAGGLILMSGRGLNERTHRACHAVQVIVLLITASYSINIRLGLSGALI